MRTPDQGMQMSNLIDISVPLHRSMPTWPGSVGFRAEQTRGFEKGDAVNVTRLDMDVHAGTHVEAPLHYIHEAAALDTIPLDTFIGPAYVADLRAADAIGPEELTAASIPNLVDRLLLRTRNSALWAVQSQGFREDYVALTLSGARWVADRGIRLLGIDYLSVQRFGDDPETHRTLMRAGVAILEGIDLSAVQPGPYWLSCLPLKLIGTEAAPARAVLEPLA